MKSGTKDYYQVLGLPRTASAEEIHAAYRTYAAKFHPDKHHGDIFFEERFREIKEAFEILFDDEKRWRYDLKRFGKSVLLKRPRREFEVGEPAERNKPKRKFRIEITHPEVYFSVFYFVNLIAFVLIKRMNGNPSGGGTLLSLFLCAVSTMFMWLFVTGIIDWVNKKDRGSRIYLGCFLLLSLGLGYVPLGTSWIP